MSTSTQSRQPASSERQSSLSARKNMGSRRTTVTLSPLAVEIVERLKAATDLTTSGAVVELILRSEPQKSWLVEEDGILVIHAPVKEGKLSDESVKRMLEVCPF